MVEETKPTEAVKELDWIEKARAEREQQEKVNSETARLNQETKEIEAKRILSGEAEKSAEPEKKKEVSNIEYYEAAKKGVILE